MIIIINFPWLSDAQHSLFSTSSQTPRFKSGCCGAHSMFSYFTFFFCPKVKTHFTSSVVKKLIKSCISIRLLQQVCLNRISFLQWLHEILVESCNKSTTEMSPDYSQWHYHKIKVDRKDDRNLHTRCWVTDCVDSNALGHRLSAEFMAANCPLPFILAQEQCEESFVSFTGPLAPV